MGGVCVCHGAHTPTTSRALGVHFGEVPWGAVGACGTCACIGVAGQGCEQLRVAITRVGCVLGGSAVGQRQGVLVRPTGKTQTWGKVMPPPLPRTC